MKKLNLVVNATLWSVVLLASGCVATRPFALGVPVGPPGLGGWNVLGHGSLRVYSAWDGLDDGDPDHEKHTSYTICSDQGAVLEKIRNRCGSFGQDPMTVLLPAGTYKIEARATNFRMVSVPIVIQADQTTVVYLDGTTRPKGIEPTAGRLVKLPNGEVVGVRAGEQP
jgi:hypothetical protein